MRLEDAEKLIGAVGTIVAPLKGEWEGEYRIIGFSPKEGDPETVATFKCETVEYLPESYDRDITGRVVRTIPPRPRAVAHAVPVAWFQPRATVV